MRDLFSLDSRCMVYFIIWKMHWFFHQLPKAWETAMGKGYGKTHQMGNPGKLIPIQFPVWLFFSIRFPSCDTLHHMGNACAFLSISHSMETGSKIHQMVKDWEIGSQTVSIVWVFFPLDFLLVISFIIQELNVFSHWFPISYPSCGILHHMGNAWVSRSISYSTRN